MSPGRRFLLWLVGLIAAVVVLFWWAEFYTDWLWFRHDADPIVFTRRVTTRLILFALAGGLSWAVLALNLRLVARRVGDVTPLATVEVEPELRAALRRPLERLRTWLPIAIAVASGFGISATWLMWQLALRAVPFGVNDPLFGRDVGFWIFALPVWRQVLSSASSTLVLSLVLVVAMQFVYGEIRVVGNELRFGRGGRRHILALAAALLLVRGGLLWLRRYELLLGQRRLFAGANWADAHVVLPMLAVSAILAVAAVFFCLRVMRPGVAARSAYYAVGVHVVVHLLGVGLAPAIAQRLIVTPNEIDAESPYIAHAIAATRSAFGLDAVDERRFEVVSDLTAADLARNRGTVANVRIWDHRPLLRTYAKLQEIRPYYDIIDVDTDRYPGPDGPRQVLLAARELNHANLDAKARSWINQHVEYTHGIGLVASPATQVSAQGQPELLLRDIPPRGAAELSIEQPRIYFGEVVALPAEEAQRQPASLLPQQQEQQQAARPDEDALRIRRRLNSVTEPDETDYLLVGTTRDELDYVEASGEAEIKHTTRYAGRSGVPLGGFFRRLLFALRLHSIELLVTRAATPESRLLLHRQVTRRCQRGAPFLRWDDNPYPVVADGRIVWICEGYTYSGSYPYSKVHYETVATPRGQRLVPTWNYLRNPVKAVVDAYEGTVDYYLVDEGDPIAATLAKVFPGLLKPAAEAPESVRAHFRYPQLLFRTQAAIYREYHMTDPSVFYTQEDLWAVAQEVDRETERQLQRQGRLPRGTSVYRNMEPHYITMSLPGESSTEFMLLTPFTPYSARSDAQGGGQRDNLIAWMVARCDPARYGELVVFKFPKDTNIYGPRQVENRIDQDDAISQAITLWDKGGSQVIRGNLLVVPIESSLLYVQPLYLESDKQGFPELKRVIVAYGEQITMQPTLDAALGELFDGLATPAAAPESAPEALPEAGPAAETGVDPALLAAARQAFEAGDAAQRAGDWAGYQRERDRLAQILSRLAGDG